MIKKNLKSKIAIIGAGASGMSVAYELMNLGFKVDIYERSSTLGGIAGAVDLTKGKIDSFYHHLFSSDKYILNFLKDNKIPITVTFKRTKTGHIWNGKYFDISNIFLLNKSGLLSNYGFLRLLIGGFLIKYLPSPKQLSNYSIRKITKFIFGKQAAERIWNPLINNKFGKYSYLIPYSWLKARINDRTIDLGYLNQGFEVIYDYLAKQIKKSGGDVFLKTEIQHIEFTRNKKKLLINGREYDRAVITTSPKVNSKILRTLNYRSKTVKYLGAFCGILEFNKRPIPSYWLGIADNNRKKENYSDFLAAISYAELDDEWNKLGKPTWPLYLAGYCSKDEYNKLSKSEWKQKMIKASMELNRISKIEKINEDNLINFKLSFAEYAQPILSPGEKLYPNPENADLCYFANMHNIFPNDRGQNRSFYYGKKIANKIFKDLELIDC